MHVETQPPYRRISSKPISVADASQFLAKYLTNSEGHPHLHPDALITPTGVTFSSHGGPTGGVIMHNLRRVAAGLRGEYLEPEATPEPEEQEEQDAPSWKKGKKKGKNTKAEEWQSMSEFEREEGRIEVGEVGERTNVVQDGGEAPEIEAAVGAEMDVVTEGLKKRKIEEGDVDKEARKVAKRERQKQLKRDKERAKAEKSA
jgi:hypothetical protein